MRAESHSPLKKPSALHVEGVDGKFCRVTLCQETHRAQILFNVARGSEQEKVVGTLPLYHTLNK